MVDGWKTIKEVRVELSEASKLAKNDAKSTANACMKHATTLLLRYCEKAKEPDYGFGRDSSSSHKKSRRGRQGVSRRS